MQSCSLYRPARTHGITQCYHSGPPNTTTTATTITSTTTTTNTASATKLAEELFGVDKMTDENIPDRIAVYLLLINSAKN